MVINLLLFPSLSHDAIAKNTASTNDQSTAVNSGQVLRIALMEDNPPFSLLLPNGKPAGLYVDIWEAWSEETNIPIIFVPGAYDENIATLKKGGADFHAGLFVSKKREEWAEFSLPIDEVVTGLFFNGSLPVKNKLEQLEGKKIGVGLGSFQEDFLKRNYPQLTIVSYKKLDDTVYELLNGKVDAVVSEAPFMNARLSRLGIEGAFSMAKDLVHTNTTHALIPKRNKMLVSIINQGIRKISISKMIEFEKKWMPEYQPFYERFASTFVHSLSIDEQAWLSKNNIFRMGIDSFSSPFEFVDKNNRYAGITADFMNILANQLNLTMMPQYGNSRSQVLEKVKEKQLDIIPAITASSQREQFFNFTDSYISFPNVIVTQKDSLFVQQLDDLSGRKVGVSRGFDIAQLLASRHPDLDLVIVETVAQGLELLDKGEMAAFVGNLAVITHELREDKLQSLKVAAFTPYKNELSIAVRKGLEPLVPILNKALANISDKQRIEITNKWLALQINLGTDVMTIAKWALPILSILTFIIIYVTRANRKLQFEISERKKVEISLEAAKNKAEKANKAKDEFLANMSHELRTPMNAVVGMSYLLSRAGLTEKQEQLNATLNSSASSLLLLIDDILDLSKVEAGKLKLELRPFKLSELISHLEKQIKFFIKDKKIRLEIKIDEEVPEVLVGDSVRLGQVLLNVMNNAAKFTEEGAIELIAKVQSQTQKDVELVFSISDTGIGMNQEQKSKIFDTYCQADSSTTRKYGGTGLGLAICKNLCLLMKGDIWADSEEGVGSQFYFTIKCDLSQSSVIQITESEQSEKNAAKDKIADLNNDVNRQLEILRGKKVLLVDDNPVNLAIEKSILKKVGVQVDTKINGRLAIQAVKDCTYDAIIMDIQMPVMDGLEATRVIRQDMGLINIPIIALSANTMKSDIQKSMTVGMNAHIGKPVNVDLLISQLAKEIAQSSLACRG